jgi:MFS family permease
MGRLRTAGTSLFLAIGGFLFGYDSGIIASTIAQPHFVKYMGTPSPSEQGGIVSSFTGGAILGALSISYLADKLGRKRTVFVGSVISVLGCALQGGAANIPMVIAGRLIAGIAVGLLSAVVPMYCSELAIAEDRGKLSGLLQVSIFVRCVALFSANRSSSPSPGASSSLNGLATAASKSTATSSGAFPCRSKSCQGWSWPVEYGSYQKAHAGTIRSPLFKTIADWVCLVLRLVEHERYEEAEMVLAKQHGNGHNQEFLELEFREIRDTIMAEKAVTAKPWLEMFTAPALRRRLLLGMGIQAFGQLSGINVM